MILCIFFLFGHDVVVCSAERICFCVWIWKLPLIFVSRVDSYVTAVAKRLISDIDFSFPTNIEHFKQSGGIHMPSQCTEINFVVVGNSYKNHSSFYGVRIRQFVVEFLFYFECLVSLRNFFVFISASRFLHYQ